MLKNNIQRRYFRTPGGFFVLSFSDFELKTYEYISPKTRKELNHAGIQWEHPRKGCYR